MTETTSELDIEREVIVTIDDKRSIEITPTKSGDTVVLAVGDPHSIAIVSFDQEILGKVADALVALKK